MGLTDLFYPNLPGANSTMDSSTSASLRTPSAPIMTSPSRTTYTMVSSLPPTTPSSMISATSLSRAPGEPLLDYMHKLLEELRACLLSDAKIKENSMCSKIEKLEEELEVLCVESEFLRRNASQEVLEDLAVFLSSWKTEKMAKEAEKRKKLEAENATEALKNMSI